MTKKNMLSLAAMPIMFCCFSISPGGAVNPPAALLKTEAQKPEGDLSRAAALFRERKYSDFFVKVGGEQDVEEVLSIIKGLKPGKR